MGVTGGFWKGDGTTKITRSSSPTWSLNASSLLTRLHLYQWFTVPLEPLQCCLVCMDLTPSCDWLLHNIQVSAQGFPPQWASRPAYLKLSYPQSLFTQLMCVFCFPTALIIWNDFIHFITGLWLGSSHHDRQSMWADSLLKTNVVVFWLLERLINNRYSITIFWQFYWDIIHISNISRT